MNNWYGITLVSDGSKVGHHTCGYQKGESRRFKDETKRGYDATRNEILAHSNWLLEPVGHDEAIEIARNLERDLAEA